jgi:hypothetical protein
MRLFNDFRQQAVREGGLAGAKTWVRQTTQPDNAM